MKHKRCCSVNYILSKNLISSENSIIHRSVSMLLTGICGTTAEAAVLAYNGGVGCISLHKEVAV